MIAIIAYRLALPPGTRLGIYEVTDSLGAGGMGEVYRARDTSLGREVAIKVLPEAFAGDPDRLARFEREAKALAALNHPNIAQIYGFEQNPAALVMELLEGRTLRDLLNDGPLPARKAIDSGAQIARGLAAAHDRGIVHRDLKPENVFVLTDGRIKILDFGLARQIDPPTSGATQTVTAMAGGTDPGTVMGTVGYMAPEQVRGEAVDHRSDLFALGALIYEMISGQRAFQRATAAETMTAILREDPPDLASSRAHLSPAIDHIVRHCLEKNPIERFQTARDVAFALDSLSGSGSGAAVAAMPAARSNRERWTWGAAVVALLAAVAWLAPLRRPAADTVSAVPLRLTLPLPDAIQLSDAVPPPGRLALSPDGTRLAFVGVDATNQRSLWLHALAEPAARKVEGTLLAAGPKWAPDGSALLFGVFEPSGTPLRIVSMDGGTPVTIGDGAGPAAWAPDGTILFEPIRGERSLRRVAGSGGPITLISPKVVNGGAGGHLSFLPDGRHFLHWFLTREPAVSVATYVGSLDSPERTAVLPGTDVSQAEMANGMLLFARGGSLMAQAFDTGTFKTVGDPSVIAEGVEQTSAGAAFTVSQTGTLAYQPRVASQGSRLTWFDRTGAAVGTQSDAADYSNLELSPDGRRLLVSVREPGSGSRDIYIVDTARGLRQRLTFDRSDERAAVWSADGTRVIYNSKGLNLYQRSAGFTGDETAVQTDGSSKDPADVSPDGRTLLYRASGPSGNDLWRMPLDGSGAPQRLLGSPFSETGANYSPDGRSIVFVADETGRSEVYVLSLEPGGGKTQISADGGLSPRWRRDGREIVYLNAEQQLMSVPVKDAGDRFEAGAPVVLFKVDHMPSAGPIFDMTADGQRFIVNAAVPSIVAPHVVVIVNWPALLKPAGRTPTR